MLTSKKAMRSPPNPAQVMSRASTRGIALCAGLIVLGDTAVVQAALVRQWGTYLGGPAIDRSTVHSTALAGGGAVLIGGETFSASGIASVGAHDVLLDDLTDGFVAKFNSSGQRIWSTYIGGNGVDEVHDIAIDKAGNIYIVGDTTSSDLATPDAFDTEIDGFLDVFLAKFDPMGGLLWLTYYGGEDDESQSALAVNSAQEIYVAGVTKSLTGISTPGVHDEDHNGGETDVFIARFTSEGDLVWGSYYGGESWDGEDSLGIAADVYLSIASRSTISADGSVHTRSLIVTGDTHSNSGIATPGVHDVSRNGLQDAFLASFDGDTGKLLWGSYFGGERYDDAGDLALLSSGEIYLVGSTSSSANVASAGAFKTSLSGNMDAFIAKFSPAGKVVWSTYFGGVEAGVGQESAQSAALDSKGRLYVAGMTNAGSGIASNASWAYDLTYDPGPITEFDLFLAKFDANGNVLGSTYYGGSDREADATVLVQESFSGKSIYLSGTTHSANAMTTPGAFDSNSQDEEAFLARFWDNEAVIKNKP